MIFILQVLSGNFSSFLNGRVIKLSITCLTSVEKPCLIFKLKGSITCKFYFHISKIYTNWFTESNVSTLAKTTDGKLHGFDLAGKWTFNILSVSFSKLKKLFGVRLRTRSRLGDVRAHVSGRDEEVPFSPSTPCGQKEPEKVSLLAGTLRGRVAILFRGLLISILNSLKFAHGHWTWQIVLINLLKMKVKLSLERMPIYPKVRSPWFDLFSFAIIKHFHNEKARVSNQPVAWSYLLKVWAVTKNTKKISDIHRGCRVTPIIKRHVNSFW